MSWIIKDAVHGVLSFRNPEMCKQIIDCSCMQRLRRIKENGFAYLVFPSAEHTRFQHSLGVAYIAGVIATSLGLSEEDVKKVEAAGLLHDVGMFPYSHTLEKGDFGYIHQLKHEKYTIDIIEKDEELNTILHNNSLDSKELIEILRGGHKLSPIISGPLDADKIDYLQRDSYFTGVKTEIDPYIYHIFKLDPQTNELYVPEKGLGNVEAIFCARYRLTQIVYYHHAVRVAQVMLNRAVMEAYGRGKIKTNELAKKEDEELLNELIKVEGYAKEIAKRLKERKLYKRVVEFDVGRTEEERINAVFAHPNSRFIKERINILRLESYLAHELKLQEGSILVDIPDPQEFEPPERKIKIRSEGTGPYSYVYQRSRYIEEIDRIYKELRKMRVYSKERLTPDLKKKCKEIIRNIAERESVDEVMEHEPWIEPA